MDKWQALDSFFNGFGVEAYDDNSVPDDISYPYITYTSYIDSIGNDVQIDASIWDLNTSWERVDTLVNTIGERLLKMSCPAIDGGRYRAYKGRPFAQRLGDAEKDIKRTVLHVNFEFMTE